MISPSLKMQCPDCQGSLVDAGEEFVCPNCGVVAEKEILETGKALAGTVPILGAQPLGSYLGSISPTARERSSKGFSSSNSTYAYLKLISDSAGREDGSLHECARMIERVGEKLSLPGFVLAQAASLARKVLPLKEANRRVTIASVSAFSLDSACKLAGVRSVSTREILEAHRSLGRRVKMSSLIQLSLDSGIRTKPRTPEDCLTKVFVGLSRSQGLTVLLNQKVGGTAEYFLALRQLAERILAQLDEVTKAGHRPSALAATSVYAADQLLAKRDNRERWITQRDVAECGETAEYTVREQYREIFAPALTMSGPSVTRRMPALSGR